MERVADLPRGEPYKLDLSCATCGYGVMRSAPPDRCPMCQAENAWTQLAPSGKWITRGWTKSEIQMDPAAMTAPPETQPLGSP